RRGGSRRRRPRRFSSAAGGGCPRSGGGFAHSAGASAHSAGGCAPLPTVVARLAARSSVPPPRIARAKPALEAADQVREGGLHDRRPIFFAMWRTSLAAVPAARPSWGT